MFIETRTTVDEVLADIAREVIYAANKVVNGTLTLKAHPTYITKTSIKESYQQLLGKADLLRRVGDGSLPAEVEAKISDAREALQTI